MPAGQDERDPILSVRRGFGRLYLLLLLIQIAGGLSLLLWDAADHEVGAKSIRNTMIYTWTNMGSVVLGSAGISVLVIEILALSYSKLGLLFLRYLIMPVLSLLKIVIVWAYERAQSKAVDGGE